MSGAVVVFSGMDGAGKSTQIERLTNSLIAKQRRTTILWSRGGYTPGMNWLKSVLRRRSGGSAIPETGHSPERTRAFAKPWVRKLWLSLAIVDLILLYGIWLRWKKRTGTIVVCDRFLDDTRLDFQLNFPQESVSKWTLWKLLKIASPTPAAAFLLTIPVAESKRRSLEKQEPFPDSEDVLEKRLAEYTQWQDLPNWIALDGLQSRDSLADEILGVVLNRLGEPSGVTGQQFAPPISGDNAQ